MFPLDISTFFYLHQFEFILSGTKAGLTKVELLLLGSELCAILWILKLEFERENVHTWNNKDSIYDFMIAESNT